MADLTTQQRAAVHSGLMAKLSARFEPCGLTKAQLLAAVVATDDWIDDNAASYNSALPAASRVALTTAQKAELFSLVALMRFGG